MDGDTSLRFVGGPLHEQVRSISDRPPPAFRAPVQPAAISNIVGDLDPSTTHTPHTAVYRLVEVTEMMHIVERVDAPLPTTTELRVVGRYEYHGLECPHEGPGNERPGGDARSETNGERANGSLTPVGDGEDESRYTSRRRTK